MITLGELLGRREYGMRLAQPIDHDSVQIVAAEVCELPDPRPWLDSDTMLLTTGIGVGHSTSAQRLLAERALQGGAAAIGFGVGLFHDEIPPALMEESARLDLPLVEIPPGTPFGLVVGAVNERSVPHKLQTAQRLLSLQAYLMDAVGTPEPESELLRRLGSLLGGTALLVSESGEVAGGPRSAVPDELWSPLRGARMVTIQHVRGLRYVTAPIGSDQSGIRRWIVVGGDPRGLPDQLARQALQSAERLVRLIDRARPPRPNHVRAQRADICDRLLGLTVAGDRRALSLRAAALGISADNRFAAAIVRPTGAARPGERRADQLGRIGQAVESALVSANTPFLLTTSDDFVLLVIAERPSDEFTEMLTPAAAEGEFFDVGFGRATTGHHELPRSLRDARLALDQLATEHRRPRGVPIRVLGPEALDLAATIVSEADQATIGPAAARLLDRVTKPELSESLHAFLEYDLDIPRAAAALHLHPNSLRYRLGRIEEQLGLSLRSPRTIANLQLALMLSEQGHGR